jgi:NAD-dependent deacetylase
MAPIMDVTDKSGLRKRTVVIFSGAGLSAESGIPTFRDANGLWENHSVEEVASPFGWRGDPSLVLRFYALRWQALQQAEPNEAHRSIARLQSKFNVVNITQNVDDLLERAGCEDVVHLHGTLTRRKCEFHQDIYSDGRFSCDYKVTHEAPVALGELCPKCGGQLRPDVVWFYESVNFDFHAQRKVAEELMREDGLFICIGTSALVAPASSLIEIFLPVKHKYLINLKAEPTFDYELLEGPASSMMSRLADRLLRKI